MQQLTFTQRVIVNVLALLVAAALFAVNYWLARHVLGGNVPWSAGYAATLATVGALVLR
jgi:hypothetical protein